MTGKKVTITEDMVRRIEQALEERKSQRDRREPEPAGKLGSEERRRSPGRRQADQ